MHRLLAYRSDFTEFRYRSKIFQDYLLIIIVPVSRYLSSYENGRRRIFNLSLWYILYYAKKYCKNKIVLNIVNLTRIFPHNV